MAERRLVALLVLCLLAAPSLLARTPAGPPAPPPGRPRADAPAAGLLLFGGRLDVNAAAAEDLAALPGIGPARARKIVAWRTRHGPFQSVDELVAVPGIGARTLAAARPSLTCAR